MTLHICSVYSSSIDGGFYGVLQLTETCFTKLAYTGALVMFQLISL